ncbi:MAG: hypothetical protein JWR35_2220 [Marmoricola sp.]|nr:hypothetical protein [Marmoricola sp.]
MVELFPVVELVETTPRERCPDRVPDHREQIAGIETPADHPAGIEVRSEGTSTVVVNGNAAIELELQQSDFFRVG